MKFLIDAQLPRRLAHRLRRSGFEPIHTLDLPQGNRTSDAAIIETCIDQELVLITKDTDFVESFILRREPRKLLLISTGNISNNDLEAILSANLNRVIDGFDAFDFIEMNRVNLIFHS